MTIVLAVDILIVYRQLRFDYSFAHSHAIKILAFFKCCSTALLNETPSAEALDGGSDFEDQDQ